MVSSRSTVTTVVSLITIAMAAPRWIFPPQVSHTGAGRQQPSA
jgi:hypothetical protein